MVERVLVLSAALVASGCNGGQGGGGDSGGGAPPNTGGSSPSANANLATLGLSALDLDQIFQPGQLSYTGSVPFAISTTTLTPAAEDANASISVDGTSVASGTPSGPIDLAEGVTTVSVQVTAQNTVATQTYTVEATRAAASSFGQTNYIKSANAATAHVFGGDISMDGDTLVVGAPGKASNATGVNGNQSDISAEGAGAAYVFTRDGGGIWSQQRSQWHPGHRRRSVEQRGGRRWRAVCLQIAICARLDSVRVYRGTPSAPSAAPRPYDMIASPNPTSLCGDRTRQSTAASDDLRRSGVRRIQ
jgi:hypothetical protein